MKGVQPVIRNDRKAQKWCTIVQQMTLSGPKRDLRADKTQLRFIMAGKHFWKKHSNAFSVKWLIGPDI